MPHAFCELTCLGFHRNTKTQTFCLQTRMLECLPTDKRPTNSPMTSDPEQSQVRGRYWVMRLGCSRGR